MKLQCKCFEISEILKPNLCNCQSKWGDWHCNLQKLVKIHWNDVRVKTGSFVTIWRDGSKSMKSKCHLEALLAILNKSKKPKSFKISLLWRKEWLGKMSVVNWKPNKQKEALKLFFDRLVVDFVYLDTFLVFALFCFKSPNT